jgi:hypothetical protein
VAQLPGPEQAKAGTMPADNRFSVDDGERQLLQMRDRPTHNRRSLEVKPGAFSRGPLKHANLVAQSQVLPLEGSARTEDRGKSGEESRENQEHRGRERKKV